MIPREHNFDFRSRNRDTHIYIFPKTGTFKFVPVNQQFGTTITHDAVKKAESNGNRAACHPRHGQWSATSGSKERKIYRPSEGRKSVCLRGGLSVSHRAESGRPPISDPVSELRRLTP
jgi:hypothetical protein